MLATFSSFNPLAKQDPIKHYLESSRESYVFSAYQVWAERRGISENWFGGTTDYWEPTPVTAEHFFDVGSVTKSIVTASVLARAVDRKQLSLTDTVSKFVPRWKGRDVGELTIQSLLSHSSGLEAWLPFHRSSTSTVAEWLDKNDYLLFPDKAPTKEVYSDVGFWILGLVIEQMGGSIEKSFEQEVLSPLKISGLQFGPIESSRAVATEFREARALPLKGIVFDENTEAMEGVGAHAGLFSSATALAPWARAWLDAKQGRSSWISQETAQLFTKPFNPALGSFGLGWDTKSAQGSSAGTRFSASSFGHLGYPGASVWIDPENDSFAILLTNRVHPSRLDERIRQFRPRFHDLLCEHWNGTKQGEVRG